MVQELSPRHNTLKLTEVGQQPEELIAQDGAIVVLVVELQDLNEIVDATGILGELGLCEDWVEVIDLHHLLALLLLTTVLLNRVEGWVEIASPQKVTNVEAIDLSVTLEVVHIEGELNL